VKDRSQQSGNEPLIPSYMFTPVGGVMDWLASYRYHSNTKRLLTRETGLRMYVPTSYILT